MIGHKFQLVLCITVAVSTAMALYTPSSNLLSSRASTAMGQQIQNARTHVISKRQTPDFSSFGGDSSILSDGTVEDSSSDFGEVGGDGSTNFGETEGDSSSDFGLDVGVGGNGPTNFGEAGGDSSGDFSGVREDASTDFVGSGLTTASDSDRDEGDIPTGFGGSSRGSFSDTSVVGGEGSSDFGEVGESESSDLTDDTDEEEEEDESEDYDGDRVERSDRIKPTRAFGKHGSRKIIRPSMRN